MDKQLMTTMNLPVGSLDAYILRVNQMPMLSAEEEQHLASEFQRTGHIENAKKMVMAHLRYVVRVARGYVGYGLPLGDLIQEGNLGLMKAVKRFDPELGVRLVSFAVHWIKAEIHEFVIKNWRIVKVATTKAQRKLFFNLRGMKKRFQRLGWFSNEEIDEVAKDLNVSRAEVIRMEERLNAMEVPYDGPDSEDESDKLYLAPSRTLADQNSDPALLIEQQDSSDFSNKALMSAFTNLDERAQMILQQRWLNDDKATLHDLSAKLGVSAERIRQLEKNALNKLRDVLAESV